MPNINRTELREIALQAAHDKAVAIHDKDQPLIITWHQNHCRVYSTLEDNLHWSVPALQFATNENRSLII